MSNKVRVLHSNAIPRQPAPGLPRLPAAHIARPRLAQRLLASDCRLTLLSAPAGCGKSVLLNECARQAAPGTRVAWLDLRGQPLAPAELLTRLATALQLAPGEGTTQAEMGQLLSRVEHPLWIFIDDYPPQASSELDACLEHLLDHSPHHLRWWVGARQRPDWNLPRLLLQGDLLELDASALALDDAELLQLLQQRGLELPETLREQLQRQNEGWLAGICLLLDSDTQYLSQRLASGSPLLRDYIQREVLSGLPEPLLNALGILAHMPRFNAELCEQVLDENGAETLLALQQRQLLRGLGSGDEWFRLAYPLATALKRRPGYKPPLQAHARACQWFAEHGGGREAAEHALWAGQPEVAARHLQRCGEDQMMIGHSATQFLQWRDELPASLFTSTPRLIILQAWALIICARLDEVPACIDGMSRFLPQPCASRQKRLLGQYQAVIGVLERQQGLASARQHCLEAMSELCEAAWSQRILCNQALAQQAMVEHDLEAAERCILDGLRLARQHGNLRFEALITTEAVHLLALRGEHNRAREQAEQMLQDLRNAGMEGPMTARLTLLRGSLLAAQGIDGQADVALHGGLEKAERYEDAYLLFGYQELIDLASEHADFEHARRLLQQAERQMHRLQVPEVRYREVLQLAQGRLWLHQGEPRRALEVSQAVLQRLQANPLLAPAGFYELLPRARLLHAQASLRLGQPLAAIDELQALLEDCGRAGQRSLACECRLALAEALYLGRQPDAAATHLQQAVAECRDLNLLQPLQALNRRQSDWLQACSPQLAKPHWRQLLQPEEPAAPVQESPLSQREQAVLELIAQGCSNLQIAEELHISLHTVKTHARRINIKLGVERRTQALARAKAEGWLK
ncbi:LuxR C-terminal-related transcriptional regulator [Zestomonas carbonaria]|uniref:HTH-type transcriptional regulator MalT n=1 Tax=Zestomonas carbonaria TaxID=2762745 RepID=A0A7U7ENR9_9GAMM|nr:LuxR C-terminal-related transcriptional regulator [Pseudomonas carbonaria]CAD5108438.1 HTH-type transcriptional regulator MalT [Pseudomonas carbonaria]